MTLSIACKCVFSFLIFFLSNKTTTVALPFLLCFFWVAFLVQGLNPLQVAYTEATGSTRKQKKANRSKGNILVIKFNRPFFIT